MYTNASIVKSTKQSESLCIIFTYKIFSLSTVFASLEIESAKPNMAILYVPLLCFLQGMYKLLFKHLHIYSLNQRGWVSNAAARRKTGIIYFYYSAEASSWGQRSCIGSCLAREANTACPTCDLASRHLPGQCWIKWFLVWSSMTILNILSSVR